MISFTGSKFRGLKIRCTFAAAFMLAAIVLSGFFSGCAIAGAKGDVALFDNAPSVGKEENKKEDSRIKIGFSQPGAESDWRVAHTSDVIRTFTGTKGYRIFYKDARNRQENQIRDVRTFIVQRVDYIILSPIVETGWDSVLQEAKEAGIPVIISDRMVDVDDPSLFTAYVGSDFKEEGRAAMKFVETYRELSGEKDDPFNIIHIQGTLGSSPQRGRTEALDNACLQHAGWHVTVRRDGDFTKANGYQIMKEILAETDPDDIDMIYCENDNMAYGVMDALDERRISHGSGGDIMIVSFDGAKSALERCMAGDINLVAECNPLQGEYILDTIKAIEAGDEIKKYTYVPETFFITETLTEEMIEERKY